MKKLSNKILLILFIISFIINIFFMLTIFNSIDINVPLWFSKIYGHIFSCAACISFAAAAVPHHKEMVDKNYAFCYCSSGGTCDIHKILDGEGLGSDWLACSISYLRKHGNRMRD